MPIPGSILDGFNFVPASVGTTFYATTATFLALTTTTDGLGQELHSFAAIDAAHTDLMCRKSPLVIVKPQTQEFATPAALTKNAKWQLNFATYIADASVEWHVVVDGIEYEILSVEHDGNRLTTRLMLGDLEPFGA